MAGQDRSQGRRQCAARAAEFGAMFERKLVQHRFALRRQANADLPPVAFRAAAPDQPALRQPVDQSHHAVMAELQALGQLAHARLAGRRFDSQKQLMLRGFQPGPPRRLLTEAQKAADLITEFCQGLIIGRAQIVRDAPLPDISYHDMYGEDPLIKFLLGIICSCGNHKTFMYNEP